METKNMQLGLSCKLKLAFQIKIEAFESVNNYRDILRILYSR